MILYFVRHGQTLFNAAGRIQGQTDTELSPLGQAQCKAVAQALRGLPIEAVYSSPLKRALEGARAIADPFGLAPIEDARLMEIHAGSFQGLDWTEIAQRFPEDCRRWKSHDPDFCIPGGESRRQLMLRAAAALAEIHKANPAQAIVVSHGGLISAALKVLLEIPAQRNPFSLMNGSITKVAWNGEAKLLSCNQVDHLGALEGNGGEL